jgi:hypothetical protein
MAGDFWRVRALGAGASDVGRIVRFLAGGHEFSDATVKFRLFPTKTVRNDDEMSVFRVLQTWRVPGCDII